MVSGGTWSKWYHKGTRRGKWSSKRRIKGTSDMGMLVHHTRHASSWLAGVNHVLCAPINALISPVPSKLSIPIDYLRDDMEEKPWNGMAPYRIWPICHLRVFRCLRPQRFSTTNQKSRRKMRSAKLQSLVFLIHVKILSINKLGHGWPNRWVHIVNGAMVHFLFDKQHTGNLLKIENVVFGRK